MCIGMCTSLPLSEEETKVTPARVVLATSRLQVERAAVASPSLHKENVFLPQEKNIGKYKTLASYLDSNCKHSASNSDKARKDSSPFKKANKKKKNTQRNPILEARKLLDTHVYDVFDQQHAPWIFHTSNGGSIPFDGIPMSSASGPKLFGDTLSLAKCPNISCGASDII